MGLFWSWARLKWADGYAISASDRYSHPASYGIWIGVMIPMVAVMAGGVKLAIA